MHRLQTRADLLVMLAISGLVAAMGVLLLLFPPRPVPSDPAAYDIVSGVVTSVADRRSGGRKPQVEFTLAAEQPVFVTRTIVYRGGADQWTSGRTRLTFHVERGGPFLGVSGDPIPVFGLVADDRPSRSLEADIAYLNAGTGPWGGLLALFIGSSGFGIALFVWRKRSGF